MGRGAEKWRKEVEPYFGFLVGFGFSAMEIDDSSWWATWAQYRSDRAAIRIGRSVEFDRADVQLIRLVDGAVPPYPIWITAERIDWMLLDNVAEVRRPDLVAQVKTLKGLRAASLRRQLAFWSTTLREVAPDFLAGDFAAMDEAGDLLRRRVAETPQEVQVWIPEDAPAGAETMQIEQVSASLPPTVGVSARRYRRRPGRRG